MKNQAEKIEWQKQAYGCTEAELEEGFKNGLVRDPMMYIASILSDAQAVLETDDKETARQYINRAKFFIFEETGKR